MIYYDRDGFPIDMIQFGTLIEAFDYKVVKVTMLWFGKIRVSTVWLGIDHDFSFPSWSKPNPHPIIFETMIFSSRFGSGEMDRYHTEAEALQGHKQMVRRYLNPIRAFKTIRELRVESKESEAALEKMKEKVSV